MIQLFLIPNRITKQKQISFCFSFARAAGFIKFSEVSAGGKHSSNLLAASSSSQPLKMAVNIKVKVHPVVLFQIADAYERRDMEKYRVIGTLLGKINHNLKHLSGVINLIL